MDEGLKKRANAWQKPAKASIDISTEMLQFDVEDKGEAQSLDAIAKFQRLALQMKEMGYSPQVLSGQDQSLGCDIPCEKTIRRRLEQYLLVLS